MIRQILEDCKKGFAGVGFNEVVLMLSNTVTTAEVYTMLDDLRAQLSAVHGNLGEGHVLLIESETGKDYPKTKTRQKNVVVEGKNRLYFYSSMDPPLRVGIYRAR